MLSAVRAATGRRYSLRASLLALVAWCAIPLVLVAAALVWQVYRLQRSELFNGNVQQARRIATAVELELSAIESSLRVLSTSPALLAGDLASFHAQARQAVSTQIARNYVLLDRQGRQVLNTLLPFGAPLPRQGNPPQLGRVFSGEGAVLTGLFTGPVTNRPILAMGVPVWRGGEVRYCLSMGLEPAAVSRVLARQSLQSGWQVSVLDGAGTVVAQLPEAGPMVGRQADAGLRAGIAGQSEGYLRALTVENERTLAGFRRLAMGDWVVVVEAPQAMLDARLRRLILVTAAATLLALALGIWLALRVVRRVMASVNELNDAALAISEGQQLTMPASQLIETEAVGVAMVQASQAAARIRYMAQHDALTGLPNRVLFYELLQHQLALAQRQDSELALLALDLDGFKAVNDNYGHAVGDRVLQEAACRIAAEIRTSDAVARMGGDEFAVLLCDADRRSAGGTVERLLDVLAKPYTGVDCPVSASVGVAVFPASGRTMEELMQRADDALYAAKHAGKGQAVYADSMPETPPPAPDA